MTGSDSTAESTQADSWIPTPPELPDGFVAEFVKAELAGAEKARRAGWKLSPVRKRKKETAMDEEYQELVDLVRNLQRLLEIQIQIMEIQISQNDLAYGLASRVAASEVHRKSVPLSEYISNEFIRGIEETHRVLKEKFDENQCQLTKLLREFKALVTVP